MNTETLPTLEVPEFSLDDSQSNPKKLARLEEAFATFNQATQVFQDSYARLENQIADLNLELECKNEELEDNLRERKQVQNYLATLLETMSAGVVVVDQLTHVRTINRAAREIFALPEDQELPQFLGMLIPDLGKAGSVQKCIARDFQEHIRFELELSDKHQWLDIQIVPSDLSAVDVPRGAIFVIHDITEIKRLSQQAQLSSRLSAMGEVAMNVAHEVRNPLGSIELFSSMLRRELEDQPELQGLASHILTGVRNIDRIVSNILLFARNQEIKAQIINPGELLEDTLLYAEAGIQEKQIRVSKRFESLEPAILLGDSDLLKQVFLNIVQNAVQAMSKNGHLELSIKRKNGCAIIQIFDNGSGIPSKDQRKLFDPFYTTRTKGTGLGLTIAHRIIQAHRGTIEFESRNTGGTVFTITLPLSS